MNGNKALEPKLLTLPILQYPDFSKKFCFPTDASNGGLEAVISQGEIGKDLPISCVSSN